MKRKINPYRSGMIHVRSKPRWPDRVSTGRPCPTNTKDRPKSALPLPEFQYKLRSGF